MHHFQIADFDISYILVDIPTNYRSKKLITPLAQPPKQLRPLFLTCLRVYQQCTAAAIYESCCRHSINLRLQTLKANTVIHLHPQTLLALAFIMQSYLEHTLSSTNIDSFRDTECSFIMDFNTEKLLSEPKAF